MKAKGFDAGPTPKNLFVWTAFMDLRGARGASGTIPISEIAAYCEIVGFRDNIQKTRLMRMIASLDRAEVENG